MSHSSLLRHPSHDGMKMPDEDQKASDDKSEGKAATSRPQTRSARDFFRVPPALKRVFDKFPLVIYEANELPIRAAKRREKHALYIFATEEGARDGRPSFNPGCLRWQARIPPRVTRGGALLTAPRRISTFLASTFEPLLRTTMLHRVAHYPLSFLENPGRRSPDLSRQTSFRNGRRLKEATAWRSLPTCATKPIRL